MAIKPVISLTGGFDTAIGVPYPYQTSPARPVDDHSHFGGFTMLGNEIYHEKYRDHYIRILRSGQRYIGQVLYLDKVLYTDDGLRADAAAAESSGKQHLLAHLRWWTSYGKRRNTGRRAGKMAKHLTQIHTQYAHQANIVYDRKARRGVALPSHRRFLGG